jgi:hypothetical protein
MPKVQNEIVSKKLSTQKNNPKQETKPCDARLFILQKCVLDGLSQAPLVLVTQRPIGSENHSFFCIRFHHLEDVWRGQ